MSWNGYPKRTRNYVIKCLETNRARSVLTDDDVRKKMWLDLPYNGKQGEQLVKSLAKKLNFILNIVLTLLLSTEQPIYLCFVQLKI